MSDLKPCPFCGSIPEFGPIYDPDERRHMDMDLECCVTMTARISYPEYTAMNSFALKDALQAELTKEWNRRTQPEATQVAQYTCQRHVDEVKKGGACVWCQLEDAIAKSPMPGEVTLRAMYQPTNPPRLMGYDVIDASGKLIGVLKPDVWMGELPADGTKLYTAPAQDLSAAILAITANKRAADHLKMREFNGYLEGFAEARNKAAALASSANALSAGGGIAIPIC